MKCENQTYNVGDVLYESVNSEDILGRLKEIPEIEIIGFHRGLARNGRYEPAFLDANKDSWWHGRLVYPGSGNYDPLFGFTIDITRKRTPLKERAMQKLGISEQDAAQKIEDLVVFIENKLGFQSFNKRIETGKGHKHGFYPYPFLQYIEFGGEIKGEVNLVNLCKEDFGFWHAKELINNGHIVKPTTIRVLR